MDVPAGPPTRQFDVAVIASLLLAAAAMAGAYAGLNAGLAYDVAWTASALGGTIGTFGARRRARPENRGRWTLWTIATGSWLFGQLMWDLFGIIGFPGDPNLADAGWWAFAVIVLLSVLRFPRSERGILALAAVESVPLVGAVICLCLALLWRTYSHSSASTLTRLSDLAYPCLYGSATILTLQAMLGGALRGLRGRAIGVFFAGTATISVAFMFWSSQLLDGTYVAGQSPLDPLWVIGLGAIGVGGLLAARAPEDRPLHSEPNHMGVVLPAGVFSLLFGALLLAIIVGTALRTEEILVLGVMSSGAALVVRSALLSRRMRELLERERAISATLSEREIELARLNTQLLEDSRHDPLTGIRNRRALADDLAMYQALQRENGAPIAVLLCDIDHFKAYNDRFGHLAGDHALCQIAATARGALRPQDASYRFGGEELLLILRDADPDVASAMAERVRTAIEHAALAHPHAGSGVLTVSIGVAAGLDAPEDLLAQADAALYEAKEAGRNRVVLACHAAAVRRLAERAPENPEEPAPRHLRSMLAVSRAAASGLGVMALLSALADAIRSELSFDVVAVNLRETPEQFRTVAVLGDPSAREVLLNTTMPIGEWEAMLACGEDIHGAAWLPAGSHDPDSRSAPTWRSPKVARLGADSWHPQDMLLLPLRSGTREVLGFLSVDQPLLGRRPTEAEIGILMAVADHAALALEQVQQHQDSSGRESEALRLAAVMLLAEALDLRDPSTALHSRTVGRLARLTAIELGLDEPHVERIYAAGVLHDLGKLGISDAILQKPTALDDAEWREMRRHPEVGARILEHAGMRDIAAWVRAHHERLDGCGYPLALGPEEISLEARILSVADAYEAMIADRPYRAGMAPAVARDELLRCGGTQFDPAVVIAFLRAIDMARTEADDAAVTTMPPGPRAVVVDAPIDRDGHEQPLSLRG